MKRLFTDKIENMRDIGGYSIDNNKVVKTGSLVRTNVVTSLNEKVLTTPIKTATKDVTKNTTKVVINIFPILFLQLLTPIFFVLIEKVNSFFQCHF